MCRPAFLVSMEMIKDMASKEKKSVHIPDYITALIKDED